VAGRGGLEGIAPGGNQFGTADVAPDVRARGVLLAEALRRDRQGRWATPARAPGVAEAIERDRGTCTKSLQDQLFERAFRCCSKPSGCRSRARDFKGKQNLSAACARIHRQREPGGARDLDQLRIGRRTTTPATSTASRPKTPKASAVFAARVAADPDACTAMTAGGDASASLRARRRAVEARLWW